MSQQQQQIDMTHSVVMSGHELSYLRHIADTRPHETRAAAKKRMLKTMSHERYKKWGNTLEAIREKKRSDRQKRLDEIEAAQQVIDEKEAQYQESQRRMAIDRANRMLYQDTDRVKQFHSGLLLSNVMKEREQQVKIIKKKKQHEKKLNQMYLHMQEENVQKLKEREEREKVAREKKSHEMAQSQLKQLAEVREQQRLEMEEQARDGLRMKALAAKMAEEARERELERAQMQRQANEELMQANVEMKKLKEEERAQEALEDVKIAKYAAEKERTLRLRKEHEAEVWAKKKAIRDAMLKRQEEHLRTLMNDENARVENQVQEQRRKDDNAIAEKAARLARQKASIDKSRALQIERKRQEREAKKREEAVMAEQWRQRKIEMEAEERELVRQEMENALNIQGYIKDQMHQTQLKKNALREQDMEEARLQRQQADADERIFLEYANQCVEDFGNKGKSTLPMQLILKGTATNGLLPAKRDPTRNRRNFPQEE